MCKHVKSFQKLLFDITGGIRGRLVAYDIKGIQEYETQLKHPAAIADYSKPTIDTVLKHKIQKQFFFFI